jgi:hypothetical protein
VVQTWKSLQDNPLFMREDRRLVRNWPLILVVYLALWLPLNVNGRDYISDFLIGTFFPFAGTMLILPLYFLETVLRPDLFFALIMGRWIAFQFCNQEFIRDLRITLLSTWEVIHGILSNYLILLCGFQISGIYLIYHKLIHEQEMILYFSPSIVVDFTWVVLTLATLEDCTYAIAVLLIFVWELVNRNLSVGGVLIALLKVTLLLFPLMIATMLYEYALFMLYPYPMSLAMEMLAYNLFWFSISIPMEIVIIVLCLRRLSKFLRNKWEVEGE